MHLPGPLCTSSAGGRRRQRAATPTNPPASRYRPPVGVARLPNPHDPPPIPRGAAVLTEKKKSVGSTGVARLSTLTLFVKSAREKRMENPHAVEQGWAML